MKVAGSSVESFFGKYCIDPNKDYYYTDAISEHIDEYGIVGRRGNGEGSKWVSHKGASEIKLELGTNKFNEYYKFCVIRNPYDKMVSRYFYNKCELPFKEVCKKTNVSNLNIHCIDGKSVCDYFIRYEHLEEDIVKVCKHLKINDYDINLLPKHKSHQREKDNGYRDYYDEETRKIVYENHKKEFEMFGYKF